MSDITLEQIVDRIGTMTIMEVNDLVKAIEEKYDVSAAAPVAMAGPMMAAAPVEEEKDSFTVTLKEAGAEKIKVIKEIRAITGLGLKEAKDLVESAPKAVKEEILKDEAEAIKKQLEAVGAKVELS